MLCDITAMILIYGAGVGNIPLSVTVIRCAGWKKNGSERANELGMHDKCFGLRNLVGVCGLTDINLIHRRAEFSLYIFPEYHRRGYAKDALKALFRHGFDDLNLHSIWGETFDGNPALSLFTDKLGMVYEGTRRQFYFKNGKYVDAHIISLTKEEFYERRNDK